MGSHADDVAGKKYDEFDFTPGISSTSITITVTSSYTINNNGFQEIQVYAESGEL